MTTKETNSHDAADVGQKLLAHSKSAEFTARRGLALELFPFIFGASQRMSSRAISQFLAKELGVKLSSVTINKAVKDAHKNWNLYFDEIEKAGLVHAEDKREKLRAILFQKQYLLDPPTSKFVKNALRFIGPEEYAYANQVLRSKWFNIEWEIRLKALPYLEHRLGGKVK